MINASMKETTCIKEPDLVLNHSLFKKDFPLTLDVLAL